MGSFRVVRMTSVTRNRRRSSLPGIPAPPYTPRSKRRRRCDGGAKRTPREAWRALGRSRETRGPRGPRPHAAPVVGGEGDAVEERSEHLEKLGEHWAAAERRGDTEFLACVLANDFVAVGSRGLLPTEGRWRP